MILTEFKTNIAENLDLIQKDIYFFIPDDRRGHIDRHS